MPWRRHGRRWVTTTLRGSGAVEERPDPVTAKAARLQHAQSGGAAAGKELLVATVARMAEVLGEGHPVRGPADEKNLHAHTCTTCHVTCTCHM